MLKINRQQRKFLKKIFSNDTSFFMLLFLEFLFFVIMMRPIYVKKKFLNSSISLIRNQKKEIFQHNRDLHKRIDMLKNDFYYIEKIARTALGMSKKDEILYKIVD